MDLLINSLLEYSRTGRKELKVELVNFDKILNDIVEQYKNSPDSRKINWIIGKLGFEYADEILIRQVWANLISNSYKYTSTENKAEIEVGAYVENDKTIYYVKDNGVGFDMKYYDKIFGVFQRLHNEQDFKGIGIGLSNVQKIISMHHGEIWAESKVNEGSIFKFYLRRN